MSMPQNPSDPTGQHPTQQPGQSGQPGRPGQPGQLGQPGQPSGQHPTQQQPAFPGQHPAAQHPAAQHPAAQPTTQFPQHGTYGRSGEQGGPVPPAGYAGQPAAPTPAQAKASKAIQLVWTLGLISLLGVILGLSISEDGSNQWHDVKAWGGLAIAGAALTLAPAVRGSLTPQRAWQVAACGAGALVLFWVLFTLPSVGSNTSLLTTVGVAAGVINAWIAPGREAGPTGPTGSQSSPQNTW